MTSPALRPGRLCRTLASHLFHHDPGGTLKLHLRHIVCNNIADGHTDPAAGTGEHLHDGRLGLPPAAIFV